MTHSRILPHSPWRPGKARNGKIARLPEALRQTINLQLLDGLTYEAIIARLGDQGKHLNYHNLKRWRQGGYQDWLLARQSADRSQLRAQLLQKLISQTNPQDLSCKLTSVVALQYIDFFLDLDAESLAENLQADPSSVLSLLNSIAKNSDISLKLDKIRKPFVSQSPKQAAVRSSEPNQTNERL
jgi:hypothetical protein